MQYNSTYINLYWPNTTKYQTVPPFTDPLPLITDQVPPITNQYCPVEKLTDTENWCARMSLKSQKKVSFPV